MSKTLVTTLVIGFIIIIAVLTNPDKSMHNTEIKDFLYSTDLDVLGIASALINNKVDEMVRVDNYVLFSITKLRFDSSELSVGYGLFGNVFIYDEILNLKYGKSDYSTPSDYTTTKTYDSTPKEYPYIFETTWGSEIDNITEYKINFGTIYYKTSSASAYSTLIESEIDCESVKEIIQNGYIIPFNCEDF